MKNNIFAIGAVIVLIVLCMMWRAAVIGPNAYVGIDDANIYYTYVRNIANGFGPVFSVGSDPVEGFTSPAWLVLLTFGNIVTNGNIDAAALGLSFLCVAATLIIVLLVVKRETNWLTGWLVVIACISTGGFIDWLLMSGMDTCLWALELTIASVLLTRNSKSNIGLTLVLCLFIITRPEGMLVATLLAAADIIINKRRFYYALPVVLTLIGLVVIRIVIFGHPLPNTYYAKVSPEILTNLGDGFIYIAKWIGFTSQPVALAFFLSLYLIIKKKLKNNGPLVFFSIGLSTLIIITVGIEGGDHFNLSRFLQPVTALIWLSAGIILHNRYNNTSNKLVPMYVFTLAILVNQLIPVSMIKSIAIGRPILYHITYSQIIHEFNIAAQGRMQGTLLQSLFNGGQLPSLGVIAAGGVSYAYNGPVIDMLGLNNERIAHAPIEGDYGKRNHRGFRKSLFYAQPPDVLYGFTAQTDSAARAYSIDSIFGGPEFDMMTHGLVHDARFQEMYDLYHVQNGNLQAWVFARNKWVEGQKTLITFRRVRLL